jgi:hypothetical protein
MIYRIKNWIENFENNRTKEMKDMRWVPVPNKHDGEGFRRIMAEKDGIIIYGCWNLILQTASKSHPRGTLLRDDGTPITAAIISLKTGWGSVKDFQRTLDFCSSPEVGWIEILTQEGEAIPHPPAEIPHPPARNGRNGMEEKGKDICDSWNSIAKQQGLAEISKITDQRYMKYQRRLESFPEFWDILKRELPLLGEFARGSGSWKLGFDFCVESDGNFAKLSEGQYRDNKKQGVDPTKGAH